MRGEIKMVLGGGWDDEPSTSSQTTPVRPKLQSSSLAGSQTSWAADMTPVTRESRVATSIVGSCSCIVMRLLVVDERIDGRINNKSNWDSDALQKAKLKWPENDVGEMEENRK